MPRSSTSPLTLLKYKQIQKENIKQKTSYLQNKPSLSVSIMNKRSEPENKQIFLYH